MTVQSDISMQTFLFPSPVTQGQIFVNRGVGVEGGVPPLRAAESTGKEIGVQNEYFN